MVPFESEGNALVSFVDQSAYHSSPCYFGLSWYDVTHLGVIQRCAKSHQVPRVLKIYSGRFAISFYLLTGIKIRRQDIIDRVQLVCSIPIEKKDRQLTFGSSKFKFWTRHRPPKAANEAPEFFCISWTDKGTNEKVGSSVQQLVAKLVSGPLKGSICKTCLLFGQVLAWLVVGLSAFVSHHLLWSWEFAFSCSHIETSLR